MGQQRAAAGARRLEAIAGRRHRQCEHPGRLERRVCGGVLTLGTPGTSGHVVGVSLDHSIILRGDTTNPSMNYSITPVDSCAFIEFGGRWVFRRINPGLNENLFEINTANVFYKSVALQRIPYVSCRVNGTLIGNSRGQIVPTVSSPTAGQRTVTLSPAHPALGSLNPMLTLISNLGTIYVDPPPADGSTLHVYMHNVAGTATNLDFYLVIL